MASECELPTRESVLGSLALPPPPLMLPPPPFCCQACADIALAHCRYRQCHAVGLPPPPHTLPLPLCRRQAATHIALLRCRHCRSLSAAATALPPLSYAPPPRFALSPPPLTNPCCRRHRAVALPPLPQPPPCCHRAAAVTLCAAAALHAASCTMRGHSEAPWCEPITNPIIRVLGISWMTRKMTRTNISQYILRTYCTCEFSSKKKIGRNISTHLRCKLWTKFCPQTGR